MAEPSKLLRFRPSRVLLHLKNSYKAAIFSHFRRFCEKFSHFSRAFFTIGSDFFGADVDREILPSAAKSSRQTGRFLV